MSTTFVIKSASRSGSPKPPVRVSVDSLESTTVGDLKKKFFSQINRPNSDVNRYRFIISSSHQLSPNEKALSTFQFNFGTEVEVEYKDLGPQISWKSVFIVEYFFPMIIFPTLWALVRMVPSSPVTRFIYGTVKPATLGTLSWQNMLAIMFTLHFFKREIETIFIHRFGNDTMPLSNIFKNSGYYWMFAFWIAHVTLNPMYTVPSCEMQKKIGLGLFVVCELLNLKAHVDLRNLRPAGTRIRKIPRGILFSLVSCPNYLFEILSWVGFTLASQSVAAAAFTVVGAGQMAVWAKAKHSRYRKEFDGKDGREMYPKRRTALVPFVF